MWSWLYYYRCFYDLRTARFDIHAIHGAQRVPLISTFGCCLLSSFRFTGKFCFPFPFSVKGAAPLVYFQFSFFYLFIPARYKLFFSLLYTRGVYLFSAHVREFHGGSFVTRVVFCSNLIYLSMALIHFVRDVCSPFFLQIPQTILFFFLCFSFCLRPSPLSLQVI